MKKWKELEKCHDFAELRANFSDDMLDYFEKEIEDYLNDVTEPEDASLIVHWFEGALTTEDLILDYGLLTN